jgi:mRNA-degrading endonuclease toxin of MazEF toxin-antitoxin module
MATHNFDGRITALIPRGNRTLISLDLPEAAQPAEGQFVLPVSHANYNSIYSLALAAAINRYTVRIRTTVDIDPGDPGEVMYTWVRWT